MMQLATSKNMEVVWWIDSMGSSEWHNVEVLDQVEPLPICVSVGFVVRETEESLSLIQTGQTKLKDSEFHMFFGEMTIPKVAIKARYPLNYHPAVEPGSGMVRRAIRKRR